MCGTLRQPGEVIGAAKRRHNRKSGGGGGIATSPEERDRIFLLVGLAATIHDVNPFFRRGYLCSALSLSPWHFRPS